MGRVKELLNFGYRIILIVKFSFCYFLSVVALKKKKKN